MAGDPSTGDALGSPSVDDDEERLAGEDAGDGATREQREAHRLRRAAEASTRAVAGGVRAVATGTRNATVATVRTTASFGFGFWCSIRGVGKVAANPLWWPFAIVPALLALAAFVVVFWWSGSWLTGAVQDATAGAFGDVSGIAAAVLAVLVWITVALIAFYALFPPFARLVAAPFMAFFAERAVMKISGTRVPPGRGPRVVRWFLRPVLEALVLLLVRIVVVVFALPLLLIPVVGQILFAAALFPLEAMDLLDWAQSARGVPLSRRLPFLRQNLTACTGLGAGAALFLFVPLVNVLVLPALLVGAVLLDQRLSPDFPSAEPAADGLS